VTVNGYETVAMVLDPVKGEILPEVIEGREPRADDEVALGRDTLDTVGVSIGDRVRVVGRSRKSESFRVVGAVVYPTIEEASPLADGVALSAKGGARLLVGDVNREDAGIERLVIRWAPGVDPDAALKRLGERAQVADLPLPPAAVKGLDDVRQFPVVAAIALAVLGVIATGHALFVTVRRRRLELGILSALGFAPGQRRAVIAVQATTVALVALVIGLPLGAVAGRLMWSVIADSIGVRDDVVFPLPLLAAGSVALVVALNLIAALPARSAGRLRVAEALRSE
jgi:ABC-type lipoprotein release transport system permease subunit